MPTWEETIAETLDQYAKGEEQARKRRAMWPKAVERVLLPTLSEAASLLRSHGRGRGLAEELGPHAKHLVLGSGPPGDPIKIEAVQLYTGQTDLLGAFPVQRGQGLIVEIGATLGYSLGIAGNVGRWHIDHWLDTISPRGQMQLDEEIEDASQLTVEKVREDVTRFLRRALSTSYRAPHVNGRRIGFAPVPSFDTGNEEDPPTE